MPMPMPDADADARCRCPMPMPMPDADADADAGPPPSASARAVVPTWPSRMSHVLRSELIATARAMHADGLAPGTSGNVSARTRAGLLITPSGVPYDALAPSDLCELDARGEVVGPRRLPPSSEWRLHLGVYAARPEVAAIVHTHSRFATTLSTLRRDLPAVHYMIAVAGGPTVRCARYATYGTAALAEAAAEALVDRLACLLANHGLVALGASLPAALRVAREIEIVAEEYLRALQVGQPFVLPDEEIALVVAKFRDYGPRDPRR
jgi:L-fuculose-phosphate aldolase